MRITMTLTRSYLRCKHKALLEIRSEASTRHDYAKLMDELRDGHKQQAQIALLTHRLSTDLSTSDARQFEAGIDAGRET